MTIKRTITVSIIIVFSLLLIGLAALSCFYLFAPQYIESKLIPKLAHDNGIDSISMKIQNIGINSVEINDIKIGTGQKEGIGLDSIKILYSIPGLFNRQIKNIVLNGISLNLEYEKNHISIAGLEGLLNNRKNKTENSKTSSTPFTIKKLSISNSILHLKVNDKNLSLPFDLAASSFDQYMVPKKFDLGIYPSDYKIKAKGEVSSNNNIKVDINTNELPLDFFNDFINEIIPIDLKGKADVWVRAIISPEPGSISDISASFKLHNTIINYSGISLKNPAAMDKDEQPIDISIDSKDMAHWEYKVSSFISDYATFPILMKLSGTAELFEETQKGEMKAITSLMTGEEKQAIQWDISLDRNNSIESLRLQVTGKINTAGSNSSPFISQYNNIFFSSISPEFNARVEYSNETLSGSYLFKLKNIEANLDKMSFSSPIFSIKGDIRQEKDRKNSYISSFSIESNGPLFKNLDIMADIPDYKIKGIIQYDMENGFKTDGIVLFEKGTISMPGNQLSVKGVSAELPITWPFNMNQKHGKFSIEKIKYKNQSLGPLNLVTTLKGNELSFKGNALYPLFPHMDIKLAGNTLLDSQFSNGKIRIDIPEYLPESKIEMGKITPELKGYLLNGIFKAGVDVKYTKTKIESGLNFVLDKGNINNSEKNLNLNNVSLNLKLDDLINTKSPSGQRIKIDELSLGNILVDDLIVDFKIEGPSSLLIEQGSLKWCDGNINVQPFKIVPGKDDYDLTLLCDRLNLAEILGQLGVVNATGEGALSGKIPLHYSKDHLIFKNGILSSTPGKGGKLQVKNTEVLTNALQPGTKEGAQIEIVSEALKDFEYNSVKMDLNSNGDELKMQLQLDGKPVNKLPFIYKKDLGRFVRVESSNDGSTFEGFILDLNFSVPLDKILEIKDMLNMME